MDDTPLGYVVSIRAEQDNEKIKKMSKSDKKIRADWYKFRAKHPLSKTATRQATMSVEDFRKLMAGLIGGG